MIHFKVRPLTATSYESFMKKFLLAFFLEVIHLDVLKHAENEIIPLLRYSFLKYPKIR